MALPHQTEGVDDYEAKRVCEADRKRKDRTATAKGSSSESSLSELACSIFNRQFRANIGLISHQRTHQHRRTPHNQRLKWSFSCLRDEPSIYGTLNNLE